MKALGYSDLFGVHLLWTGSSRPARALCLYCHGSPSRISQKQDMQIAPPMVFVLIGPLIVVIAPVIQGAGGGVISLIVISIPFLWVSDDWGTLLSREPNN